MYALLASLALAAPPPKAPRLTPVPIVSGDTARYGYIDPTGTLVIPARYDEALPFAEGVAAVKLGEKWGFVDPTGREAVAPAFDLAHSFSEGLALVSRDGHWCYVDHTGTCALAEGNGWYHDEVYDVPGDFSGGFAAIPVRNEYTGDHVRYIDKKGKERAELLGSGYGYKDGVALWDAGGGMAILDAKGIAVVRDLDTEATAFSEGLLPVHDGAPLGYVDRSGKFVIPAQFDHAGPFSEGLACVEKGEKVGWIDAKGKTVIPFAYDDCGAFSEGLAPASLGGPQAWGYIDRTGKWVVPPENWGAEPFRDGLGRIEVGPYDYRWVDTTGKVVWPKP